MRLSRIVLLTLIFTALTPLSLAQEERNPPPRRTFAGPEAHFMLRRDQPLREAERLKLLELGFRVVRPTGGNDYIIKGPRALVDSVENAREFVPSEKLSRSALREMAEARPASRLRITFHHDVSFAQARELIERRGGMSADPLTTGLDFMRAAEVLVPDSAVEPLVQADEIFRVSGPRPPIAPDNANAAVLSSVTPLYSAPYDLSGDGVVASLWDCGNAQPDHVEYNGRMTLHDTEDVPIAQHPTHVAGTLGATGVNAGAKGMAPRVTLHQYDVGCPSGRPFLIAKNEAFPALSIRADNNSFSYILGWRLDPETSEWVWYDGQEAFGLYIDDSAALDNIARTHGTLMMFSAGNDGDDNGPRSAPYTHKHNDDERTFCSSSNGSGTDCPTPDCQVCETSRHPSDGPFTAVGPLATSKNVLAVGAVGSTKFVLGFSSRGPALDGRVKPDVVAKGNNVLSSVPTNGYAATQGTSMSSPVVTGIAALLVEQWRRTMGSPDPMGGTLRALIVAGAEDLGNAGPDYTYGFGLVNAKNSVDLIRDDNKAGTKIRRGTVQQGSRFEIPLTVTAGSNVRLTLVWDDLEAVPEAALPLVNDLDLRLIGPGGQATLPYRLDVNNIEALATTGTNTVDTIEQIELKNAPAGVYTVEVAGTRVGGGGQVFTLVGSGQFGTPVETCTDVYEPNETEAAAFGPLTRSEEITARTCSAQDVDFYRVVANETGPVSVVVRATDTPVRATLTGGPSPVTVDIQPGQSATLQTSLGSGAGASVPMTTFLLRIASIGAPGDGAVYTVKPDFGFSAGRRRGARPQ